MRFCDDLLTHSNSSLIISYSTTFIKMTFINKLRHNIFTLQTKNIRIMSLIKFTSIYRLNSKFRLSKITNKTNHENKF